MVAEFATDLIENRLWLDDQARLALSTPANARGSRQLGRRAVVVGGGIGGPAAAGALAQHFERVDTLERDRLATSVASRSGTPQDRHPHGLLAGGLRALDKIFPDSNAISPQPTLFPSRSREMFSSSGRMSACCRSGISGSRCSARHGR